MPLPRCCLISRSPTEAEHIVGDLVRRADRHGVDAPILRAALCNLQIYEARRSGRV